MNKWPLIISVPHSGKTCPEELLAYSNLTLSDIISDGDEQAENIYFPLQEHVEAFVSATIARAFIDLNRRPDDFSDDGVFKKNTIWNKAIYSQSLPKPIMTALLNQYYYPYHEYLSRSASPSIRLAIDCHTMTEKAPTISKNRGTKRPDICISFTEKNCPPLWISTLTQLFSNHFRTVNINDPFIGGFIMKSHEKECPWIQLELNRSNRYTIENKQKIVEQVLAEFVQAMHWI